MGKKQEDEGYKITFHFKNLDEVKPGEVRLIENQLGELFKQVIREANQED